MIQCECSKDFDKNCKIYMEGKMKIKKVNINDFTSYDDDYYVGRV